ncbi:MAG: NfeD family protein [Clostridia bacterium]|nr:NfeD family protein [Clostridia bacterium]
MFAWWESLGLVSQIFSCIAIPATVVLAIQTTLMLSGLDSEGGDPTDADLGDATDVPDWDADSAEGVFGDGILDSDPDPSGLDGLRIFSIRGIIAFLVMFGWVGLVLDGAGAALWLSLSIATLCGFATMVLLALLLRWVMRLRNNGNLDNRNAIGTSGRVYLTIPANRSGEGKVNILLQGTYVERDAVTDEAEPLPTGCEVVVIGLSGQTTLVVKRK